ANSSLSPQSSQKKFMGNQWFLEHFSVPDRLRPSHVELNSPFQAKCAHALFCELLRQQHFFFVEVLAGQLRQSIKLCFEGINNRFVARAEIDRRVPHL